MPNKSNTKSHASKKEGKKINPEIEQPSLQTSMPSDEDLENGLEDEHGESLESSPVPSANSSHNTQEMSASFKNFRHHPDMENFYRFIFENDLRHEALSIIDEIILKKQKKKQIQKRP